MNPAQLFAHFDRMSEAPDAAPRLRRFILDLAVRGKLVEQNPGDQPAPALLKSIELRRELIARKQPSLPKPDASELDFEIPPTWCWVRLNEITSYIQRGKSPAYATSNGCPVISQRCVQWAGLDLEAAKLITNESIRAYEDERFLRTGDLLWNSTGTGTIGRIIRLVDPPAKLVCDSHVTVVRCIGVNEEYVRTWLRSDYVYGVIESRARGATNQVELTSKVAAGQVVPLPPLAEQHRIVAKVDELMALCDQLEAAKIEREARRDRLTAASLSRLSAPDTTERDASFHILHIGRMTARVDQVQLLRQTVLSLAVRGRLVVQDPNDEEATTMLARIGVPNGRQTRRGVPDAVARPPSLERWPVPESWEWVSAAGLLKAGAFIDIKDGNHGTNHPKTSEFTVDGLPFITAAQVRGQSLDFEGAYKIKGKPLERLRVGFAAPGDVIFTHKGTVGRVALAQAACVLSPQTTYYRVNSEVLYNRYVMWFMASSAFSHQVDEVKRQTTRDFVAISKQYEFFHAIPPLAEQRRIVAQVEALLGLCDRLEEQLRIGNAERGRLLESVLHHALLPHAKGDNVSEASAEVLEATASRPSKMKERARDSLPRVT